ncbi:MAG: hypothetical protein PHT27_07905 [Candidatus Izemoplasmatales bacterium]|nr:hypothetical protein [Candidatus Izemoplasmatales bacterium]
MEKKSEVKYPEGGILKCPCRQRSENGTVMSSPLDWCGKGYCVAADVKLLKTRQRYAELEIIRLKKILTKCLSVNLEEDNSQEAL